MKNIDLLVVEDSVTQAERLKSILESQGFHVTIALNGHDALVKAQTIQPALIISDIIMPEMNGYELCSQLRRLPQFREIPIILLTSLSDVEDVIRGLQCGANYFITKPYEDSSLISYVQSTLKLQEIRHKNFRNNQVRILVKGKEHVVNADKSQILDFLISTYDEAIRKNQQLLVVQEQLTELNFMLEKKIEERTSALSAEIEERKHYERQFIQAQKMESIGQLTGGIAHDFNNLLMVIHGNIELLQMDLNNDEINKNYINPALEAIQCCAALINQLMAFSRHQILMPRLVNIQELILNTTKLLHSVIGAAIEVQTNIPDNLWTAWVDPSQLETALVNLAVNSRDAMKGRGRLTIAAKNISVEKPNPYQISPGQYVEISVTDSGEGIPPDILTKIFEPFFTTKEVGKGTGLGLSMVYGFAKQSNGHITVHSKVGHGTTVSLCLPKASPSQITSIQSVQVVESNDATKHHGKILLVEDENNLRDLTTKYLKLLGYDVLQAHNGPEALTILEKEKNIDLLLTDVIMPGGLTGPELALKAKVYVPGLKILFISGYSKNLLVSDQHLQTADQLVLNKPFNIKDLAKILKTIFHSPRS